MAASREQPILQLTPHQMEEFGRELDALRRQVVDDLGALDAEYIRRVMRIQARVELAGRGLMFFGKFRPAWAAGVACLSLAHILSTEEIGHNVLHGQYNWTHDPSVRSRSFEWGSAFCPSENWRYMHNYLHHAYTNILERDPDIGYGVLRMSEKQPWRPYCLGNPVYFLVLMLLFDWLIGFHYGEMTRCLQGEERWSDNREVARRVRRKVSQTVLRETFLYPGLTGKQFRSTLVGNVLAVVLNNIWASSIIFCGHFPAGTVMFTEEETESESRGHWYYRQLMGTANISGGRVFHVLSGHLGYQIEHHLFPDIPSRRYPQIACQVRAVCESYGLPYNTGKLHHQLGSVWRTILQLALPPGAFARNGSGDAPPRTAPGAPGVRSAAGPPTAQKRIHRAVGYIAVPAVCALGVLAWRTRRSA